MAATGCWLDRPEGARRRNLLHGVVPGSGLRRRSSRRGVAEATVTCVPRLLLAFPPVAPLWHLGRRNENDRPAPPDPPHLPHLTLPFRGRSRQIGSRRISPWPLLFCHRLADSRTFRLNSNFSKPTVELQEDPFLPKLLSRAHPLQIPFVFRSVGAFCLNSIFRQKLWTDLFLKLFPCLAQFLAGDFQKSEDQFRPDLDEYLHPGSRPRKERPPACRRSVPPPRDGRLRGGHYRPRSRPHCAHPGCCRQRRRKRSRGRRPPRARRRPSVLSVRCHPLLRCPPLVPLAPARRRRTVLLLRGLRRDFHSTADPRLAPQTDVFVNLLMMRARSGAGCR